MAVPRGQRPIVSSAPRRLATSRYPGRTSLGRLPARGPRHAVMTARSGRAGTCRGPANRTARGLVRQAAIPYLSDSACIVLRRRPASYSPAGHGRSAADPPELLGV